MPTARPRAGLTFAALASLTLVAGCERPVASTGEYSGTMVISSGGGPDILLPPSFRLCLRRARQPHPGRRVWAPGLLPRRILRHHGHRVRRGAVYPGPA